MFIQFSVSNYRSIGEEQVLSLIPATNQREHQENILEDGKNIALNVIAIYGANGSGKSNVLSATRTFKSMIQKSSAGTSTSKLPYDPFLLRENWDKRPTKFEIVFSLEEIRYRYGFEYDADRVIKEWLYRKNIGRESDLFLREGDVIDVTSGFKGKAKLINTAIEATRPNGLFLSTCDTLNVEEAKEIFMWLLKYLHMDGDKTEHYRTERLWNEAEFPQRINKYLKHLKLGLSEVAVDIVDGPIESPSTRKQYNIVAKHKLYDKEGKPTKKKVSWSFLERESNGSIKAFQTSGLILVTLLYGGVIVIDEMEARMHPLITLDTINMFLNKETNPHNAQLIFATHDTNLLTYSDLRRDQIYFAEKNQWESTEIYSLSDFVYINEEDNKTEKERPDTDKEKRYFEGRYGAIPVLGPLSDLKHLTDGQ